MRGAVRGRVRGVIRGVVKGCRAACSSRSRSRARPRSPSAIQMSISTWGSRAPPLRSSRPATRTHASIGWRHQPSAATHASASSEPASHAAGSMSGGSEARTLRPPKVKPWSPGGAARGAPGAAWGGSGSDSIEMRSERRRSVCGSTHGSCSAPSAHTRRRPAPATAALASEGAGGSESVRLSCGGSTQRIEMSCTWMETWMGACRRVVPSYTRPASQPARPLLTARLLVCMALSSSRPAP